MVRGEDFSLCNGTLPYTQKTLIKQLLQRTNCVLQLTTFINRVPLEHTLLDGSHYVAQNVITELKLPLIMQTSEKTFLKLQKITQISGLFFIKIY